MSHFSLRMLVMSALCCVAIVTIGCQSYQGNYVIKKESELKELEERNQTANTLFRNGNYNSAEQTIRDISAEKTVSYPLYQLELLSTLLLEGKQEEADNLILSLNTELNAAPDKELDKKAKSNWHGEINKVYLGDDHERATFYMLAALSSIGKGKYEDALTFVKKGIQADTGTNTKPSATNDYGLLYYLGYLASLKLNRATDSANYLNRMHEALRPRNYPGHAGAANSISAMEQINPNVLLVVWAGDSPDVVANGSHEEIRTIVRGQSTFDAMTVSVDAAPFYFTPNALADINYQATTRGGRLMDNVLDSKASMQTGLRVSGGVLSLVGSQLMLAGALCLKNVPAAGIALMCAGGTCIGLGVGSWVAGELVTPDADTRHWRNLPGEFYVIPLNLSKGRHTITLNGFRHSDLAGVKSYTIDVAGNAAPQIIHAAMLKTDGDFSKDPATADKGLSDRLFNSASAYRNSFEVK